MIAVRAKATTGLSLGKAANSGLRVKPIARRAGATSSSALQIVGVSNAFSASRSPGSGRRGMAASSDHHHGSPAFMGNGRRHQGLFGQMPFMSAGSADPAGWPATKKGARSQRSVRRGSTVSNRQSSPAYDSTPRPLSAPLGRNAYDRPA